MHAAAVLADDDHPAVREKARALAGDHSTTTDVLRGLFGFVRDEIRFGFPPKWDAVRASETLAYGIGYCNTKATLFLALCKVLNIPARIHTGLIKLQIMRGIFPSFVFPFLPSSGGHTWLEVELDGEWKPVDSYINDKPFYEAALRRLKASGKDTAFSISQARGPSSCEFNFGDRGHVHMGAVVEDHGTWNDFGEYMRSDRYVHMNRLQLMSFPLMAWVTNRQIARIRSQT